MEVHCTNEEAGGKKQVLAEEEFELPFAWKNYFCRLKMIEDQKRVILGNFSRRVWKIKSLIICVQ